MKTLKLIVGLIIAIIIIVTTPMQLVLAQVPSNQSRLISIDFTVSKGEIVWLEPDTLLDEIETKKMKIKVGIKANSDIDKVVIYHNGLPMSENYGYSRGASDDARFNEIIEHIIPMEEEGNEVTIYVRLQNGEKMESKREFFLLDEGLAALKNRKKYALLFSTNEYDNFNKLNNPVNDARDIAKELSVDYGFEIDSYEDPSQDLIMTKISEYNTKKYGEYDQLFIFFAGHGQFDETLDEGFIVCKDTRSDDLGRTSYISHTLLSSRVNNIEAPHIFIVIDACFSGTFDPTLASRSVGEDMYADISRLQLLERKLEFKTRQFMTSGGKVYVPDGAKGRNSPFAANLLEALRSNGGRDGLLTFSDLKGYVDVTDPQPRYGTFGDNQPGSSEFVFEKIN